MTDFDQQRIVHWVRDAFTILSVRLGSSSETEKKLRLGIETILRQLGTSPLRVLANSVAPPSRPIAASKADLRRIIFALDACLAIFQRYDVMLTSGQHRIRELVETARAFAQLELQARCAAPRAELELAET